MGFKPDSTVRHYLACIPTLTLGIMGSAVLPVSSAFASTGIVAGFVIMLVVASANAYTCDLLLWQAYKTGMHDYESLSNAVGGRVWQFITEVSIVILMVGTLVGGIAQIGEAGSTAILYFNPDATGPMVNGSGRILMVIFVVAVVAPLCTLRSMRKLEYAGWAGFIIVCALTLTILVQSIYHHVPYAGRDGEFEAAGFSDFSAITGAVSTFGFVFYVQPIMMPLLSEMPATERGVKILSWSTRVVVLDTRLRQLIDLIHEVKEQIMSINRCRQLPQQLLVVVNNSSAKAWQELDLLIWAILRDFLCISFAMYSVIGFFGAALFGSNTEGNVLQNNLGGGAGQGVLNMAMSVYLSLSLPPVEFPTRKTLDYWLPRKLVPWRWLRHLLETSTILGISLLLALLFPDSSANVLLVTGATGVMMASYVVPIVNHLVLYFGRARCQRHNILPEVSEANEKANGQPSSRPGFMPEDEIQHEMKLENGLAGVNPAYIAGEPARWQCDPQHYRTSSRWTLREVLKEVCVPALVLAVGIFCSIASLSTLGQD